MFGVQRFDPLQKDIEPDSDLKEAKDGGFSKKLLEARAKAGHSGDVEKKFGHLSGAQRRAKAKAKAEGREYTPTTQAADAAPRERKERPAAAAAAPVSAAAAAQLDAAEAAADAVADPVRRGKKPRRVQDRLDTGNAVYKERTEGDDVDDSDSDLDDVHPSKKRKQMEEQETAEEDSGGGASEERSEERSEETTEADATQAEKEKRRRKKKKDKKKKKKAIEKNDERKRKKHADEGTDPDAEPRERKPRKPKSERANAAHEAVRARAEAAQAERDEPKIPAGPMDQEEQAATEEAEALAAQEASLKAAEMSEPNLSLEELQSRLAEATTSRPTPQYLNQQSQAVDMADASGLPSWMVRGTKVVLPNDEVDQGGKSAASGKDKSAAAKSKPKVDVVPSGPLLEEAGLIGALSMAARERLGVVRLWPAQAAAIPAILSHRGDVLLSAPTGSGKTLVYALPLLHALASRVAVRLRAVVILPTRDLAMQVLSVFETLIDGGSMDLKLVSACGRERVAEEAALLNVGAVDIVVGTPGRVVGHMRDTPGFEEQLSGIDWLVIDDADRLLQQSHQDWLPRLMASVERKPAMSASAAAQSATATADAGTVVSGGVTRTAGMSLCDWVVRNDPNMRDAEVALGWRRGVRKLILSGQYTTLHNAPTPPPLAPRDVPQMDCFV